MFIETEVCPQAGDTILDLGCGTGELSAYLAELVGPEGKVVAVDPDKERVLLAKQSFGEVKNLSFVESSASNFPGIGSDSRQTRSLQEYVCKSKTWRENSYSVQ